MDAPMGPSPIAKNGQITVPKAMLERLNWAGGMAVMFIVDDDDTESLRVVPADVVARRYASGFEAERLQRMLSAQSKGEPEVQRGSEPRAGG